MGTGSGGRSGGGGGGGGVSGVDEGSDVLQLGLGTTSTMEPLKS